MQEVKSRSGTYQRAEATAEQWRELADATGRLEDVARRLYRESGDRDFALFADSVGRMRSAVGARFDGDDEEEPRSRTR